MALEKILLLHYIVLYYPASGIWIVYQETLQGNKMKKITYTVMLLMVSFAVFLPFSGCHSAAYYREEAAVDARTFLLNHASDLTLEEREYVRFNVPAFLVSDIFIPRGYGEYPLLHSSASQVCITWLIPGREEAFMVFGICPNGDMAYWSPNRLIRKTFPKEDRNRIAAIGKAQRYVWNNLNEQLSLNDANAVRFSNPEFIATSFPDEYTVTAPDGEPLPGGGKNAKVQLSLCWKTQNLPGKTIVVCGSARDENLSGWTIITGGILDDSELAANMVSGQEGGAQE